MAVETAQTSLFRIREITKEYRMGEVTVSALRGVTLEIRAGEFVVILGPSGSGKSTLLNIMGLLDVPTKGRLSLNGSDINSYDDKTLARIRNERLGFIFQTFHLIGDLSVVDNVEVPLLYRRMSGSERRKLALRALDRVDLTSRVRHFPSQLSGGQQQRVAIARSIVGNPSIILADEPTGNLDSQMGEEIMSILLDLHAKEKTTIVMVTHDQRMAQKTQKTVRLFDGRQVN